MPKVQRGDVDTLNMCIFINLRAKYVHTQNTQRHRRTLRPQIKYPQPQAGVRKNNDPEPAPDIQKRFMWEEADEDGAGGKRESANGHNVTRLGPLAHAKGRQETGAGGAVSCGQSTR